MKKIAWAIGAFLIMSGIILGAPFLRLDRPNGGETLAPGSAFEISWTAREVTQNIALVLHQNDIRVGVIAGSLAPGSSPFRWTVGRLVDGTAAPGGGYTVRVRTLDSSLRDESDGTFTIERQTGSSPLKVISPKGGETLGWWTLQPFQWSASGISGNVKVTLLRNGSPEYVLSPSVSAASGSVSWRIGEAPGWACHTHCGFGYKLRVDALDGSASAESAGTFAIAAVSKPDFQLTSVSLYPQCLDDPVHGGVMVIRAYINWQNNASDYQGPLKVHYMYLDALKGSKISKDAVLEIPSATILNNKSRSDLLCDVKGIPDGVESLTFAVMLDPDNQVDEANEKNNYVDAAINLPRNPDLAIENMEVSPKYFYNDETFAVDFTVRNKGIEPANQFNVHVNREDREGHIEEILSSMTIPTLGGSRSTSGPPSFQSFHGKYKLALQPAGSGVIRVTADSGKQIAEFNEKNNMKWDGYTIRETPDLVFYTASAWQEHMQLHYEFSVLNKSYHEAAEGVHVYILIESQGTRELRKMIEVGRVGLGRQPVFGGKIEITWRPGKYLVQFVIAGCCTPEGPSSDKRYHDKDPTNNTKEIWLELE